MKVEKIVCDVGSSDLKHHQWKESICHPKLPLRRMRIFEELSFSRQKKDCRTRWQKRKKKQEIRLRQHKSRISWNLWKGWKWVTKNTGLSWWSVAKWRTPTQPPSSPPEQKAPQIKQQTPPTPNQTHSHSTYNLTAHQKNIESYNTPSKKPPHTSHQNTLNPKPYSPNKPSLPWAWTPSPILTSMAATLLLGFIVLTTSTTRRMT